MAKNQGAYEYEAMPRIADKLGCMFHYAVYEFDMDGDVFIHKFLASGVAEDLEELNPKYAFGMSGLELYHEIIERTRDPYAGDMVCEGREIQFFDRTSAYWIGWALGHYQWYSELPFKEILKEVSYEDLLYMYYPLHEADIHKFYDIMDEKLVHNLNKFKRIREGCGLTQEELAKRSGVSINTIRAYERKSKDINKAQYDILYALANAMGVGINDITY